MDPQSSTVFDDFDEENNESRSLDFLGSSFPDFSVRNDHVEDNTVSEDRSAEVLGGQFHEEDNTVPEINADLESSASNEYYSPGGTLYWIPNVSSHFKPVNNGIYPSFECLSNMYYKYAEEAGFDVRITSVKKKGEIVTRQYLVCNREGAPHTSPVDTLDDRKVRIKRRVDIHRIGCMAGIRFRIVPGSKSYIIYVFEEKHNHPLISKLDMNFSRSRRKLNFFQKSLVYEMAKQNVGANKCHRYMSGITGGYNYLRGTVDDCKNTWRDLNTFIGGTDAQMLVDKLENRKKHVPNFSFEYRAENNKLNAMFWADETSKLHYLEFGDVISFDATYTLNRYDMVFIPFTGIDNHKKCVTFGAGLLSREDADSYIWLLNSFIKAVGKHPILVLSDQDPAMKKAISCVLPKSYHRLCMWHITSKLPLKICPDTLNNSDFKFRFHSLVWNMKIDVKQFEEDWDILLRDHGLSEDKWLNDMYDRRHYWIPAYFKDIPMSGLMRTTSRSEAQNFSFQNSTQNKCMLVNFMTSFETSMEKQRYEQSRLDFKSNQKIPQMKTMLPIEVNASRIYTREVFHQVQSEIFQSLMACTVTSMVDDGGIDSFDIREKQGRREVKPNQESVNDFEWDIQLKEKQYKVFFNKIEKTFNCSCMMYEHIGLLCRHIFCVFKFYDFNDIPARYVMRRWKKDIIPTEMLRRSFRYGDTSQNIDEVALEAFAVVDYCLSTLSYDKNKAEGYLQKLNELKRMIEDEHSNQLRMSKKDGFEKLLGVSTPVVVEIQNPSGISNKGSGTRKRMKSIKEVVIEKVRKEPRTCTWCWKSAHHDARNCDDRKNGIPRAAKPTKK